MEQREYIIRYELMEVRNNKLDLFASMEELHDKMETASGKEYNRLWDELRPQEEHYSTLSEYEQELRDELEIIITKKQGEQQQ